MKIDFIEVEIPTKLGFILFMIWNKLKGNKIITLKINKPKNVKTGSESF